MKKIVGVLLFITFSITGLYAQKDQKALQILDAMSAKYKSMPAFKVDFQYSIENPSSGINDTFKGEIVIKASKFRLKMDGQEIINNGSTVWTYLIEENEVNISDYTPTEDEVSPSTIYTVYKNGYKYLFVEEKKEDGQVYEIVELIPEDKSRQVFKIRLQIHKKDKYIKNWRIFEKSGTRYFCNITKTTPNVKVEENYFAFDASKHKGVEVIDLR
ncbi:MAG TPA: outer membrane lipoprotein carrier protein LolA [Cytophagales bacterium]|nr:outer membrane lipoprotein carrier protein LolA [Cytophagales bacterium]